MDDRLRRHVAIAALRDVQRACDELIRCLGGEPEVTIEEWKPEPEPVGWPELAEMALFEA
jgi:hypothetical protein